MDTVDPDQTRPKLRWRYKGSYLRKRPSIKKSDPYCGFGWHAPIIDFYDNGHLIEFAPLSDVLNHGPDKVMSTAFEKMIEEEFRGATPNVGGRGCRKMRWIHLPANNMEWVERVIKCVWRCKKLEKGRTDDTTRGNLTGEINDMANVDDDYPMCLRPEYWRDQQRGCLEHFSSHPLYARHMVPFFAPVPTSAESATTSKLETKRELKTKSSMTQRANMVLFIPFLHWATSGEMMTEEKALIRSLTKAFKTEGYCRPSYKDVDKMNIAPNLKIMTAFLFPDNDRCLHIPRTLDQFYYSTLSQVRTDERTIDQVVYRFAMKQHHSKVEEERQRERKSDRFVEKEHEKDTMREFSIEDDWSSKSQKFEKRSEGPPWNPPKVMMVNQLWMWIVDGDTVITSFPAKLKSDLDHFYERQDEEETYDYTKEDSIYDSTDIWRAVFRELRLDTEYGKRSQKSALDLAWSIVDQAVGVFHKRNLHPHLQFFEMFEMEINDIAFKQTEAFTTFTKTMQSERKANELGRVLSSLAFFQEEMFASKNTQTWREKFGKLKIYFKKKLEFIGNFNDNILPQTPGRRMYVPPLQDDHSAKYKKTFSEELGYEFRQYAELLENADALKSITDSLDAANAALETSMASVDCSIPALATADDEIDLANVHLDHALETLEDVIGSLKIDLVSLNRAKEHFEYAISSLDTAKDNLQIDTISVIGDNLDFAQSHIEFAQYDLNHDIMNFLDLLFTRLETAVENAPTIANLKSCFEVFIQTAKKSLEAYTDVIMDNPFDVRMEISLVREIKDILEELNIIQTVKRQQESIIEPFVGQMFQSVSKNQQKKVYNSTRLGNHVSVLQRSAENTYAALRDLLDLKQREASAHETRSASKDAKASAAQAEASTSLSAETVRQGWSIMIFTTVTIIFLPLSFFTGLFGMNAEEILTGKFTMGFYSAIMWPISFVIICFSLGLALNMRFRGLTLKLWQSRFFTKGLFRKIKGRLQRKRKRRAASLGYRTWDDGV